MPSDNGEARRVTPDNGHEIIPSWSRDGSWIYYASNRTGRFEVWKAPAAGGAGIQVTRSGGFTARESVDGQLLYYTKFQDSRLWAIPVRGGTEKLILESVGDRAFVPVADGIYYIPGPGPDGAGSANFYEFASGTKRQIAPLKQEIFESMTVSPDRKTILFSVVSRTGSNVMLVENFR
jgi:Tol biopolymer transport system component